MGVQPGLIGVGKLESNRLVEAWAELHQEELIADWQRLQDGQVPLPIAPLE